MDKIQTNLDPLTVNETKTKLKRCDKSILILTFKTLHNKIILKSFYKSKWQISLPLQIPALSYSYTNFGRSLPIYLRISHRINIPVQYTGVYDVNHVLNRVIRAEKANSFFIFYMN